MTRQLVAWSLALALAACGDGGGAEAPLVDERPVPTDGRAETPMPVPAAEPEPARSAGSEELASGVPAEGGRPAVVSPTATPAAGGAATASGAGAPAPTEQTAAQRSGAEAILTRAERTYEGIRSLQADFTQEVTVPLLNSTQRSRGTLYHRRPDRFLMRFADPQGDIVVADGRYFWMYYPSADAGQVMRTRVGEGGQSVDLQREFLSDATTRYRATLEGTETVAGRPADVLVLTPRAASPYRRVRIWVDREDALVRRFEIVEENESVRRLELRNLRSNVALSDDLFRFTPPPGTQIFEQ